MLLLKTYKNLHNLGPEFDKAFVKDPHIHYAMMTNQVGRSIVEDNRDLPLSVWPILLEIAYEKSGGHSSHREKGEKIEHAFTT